ncbi:MAG: hypothetical protein E6J87_11010 [Deltaproteobacteria bacterium]|nr:MAG: hypothetical protein E6J87_11010 [Deltaproteobacteria bacterium]
MSHPLVALANDKAVRQAAEFRDAAALLSKERLAETYAAERSAAPSVHGAGRTYFVDRSGKPPAERRKNRDEEHLGAALVRAAGDAGLELPDGAGRIHLLDYQVRAKIGPIDEPATRGIARFDLLGVGPGDRLAVIQMRYVEPAATRCRIGDTPLRLLFEGLTYCAIADANRAALSQEIVERFGRTVVDDAPLLFVLATPRYWELCRKRSTQKGAGWIRELERIASEAPAAIGVTVQYLALRLEGSPGWNYGADGPVLSGHARLLPAWEPSAGRVRPKPKPRPRVRTEPAPQIVEGDLSRPVRAYNVSDSYRAGDRISHPKLGTGVVQGSAGPGKIRVRFDERQSVLVHERSA